MVTYKGREVQVLEEIPHETMVVIKTQDGNETVRLKDLVFPVETPKSSPVEAKPVVKHKK